MELEISFTVSQICVLDPFIAHRLEQLLHPIRAISCQLSKIDANLFKEKKFP